MKVFILAAGRGRRLNPLTSSAPKCLTQLSGISLLYMQITALRASGLNDITVITGYKSEQIDIPGIDIRLNKRWAETNMVESLFLVANEFGNDFIVSYSDIVYEPSVVQSLLRHKNDISVVIDKNWRQLWDARFEEPIKDAETLKLDGQGHIKEIGRKPANLNEIEGQYIGLMRFRGNGIDALSSARKTERQVANSLAAADNLYMTEILMRIILNDTPVTAVPIHGGWLEIDTFGDYQLYKDMIKSQTLSAFINLNSITSRARG